MSIALHAPMTLEHFLAWEEQQDLRWEFDGFEPVAMTGGGSIRYPDAFVVCSPVPRGTLVVTDPVVVFEVLSPSTASTDIGIKNEEYRDTPSIQRYVMLAQDRPFATVFARVGDDWVGHIISGAAVLEMPEIGIGVPLAELYEGVSFEPETSA